MPAILCVRTGGFGALRGIPPFGRYASGLANRSALLSSGILALPIPDEIGLPAMQAPTSQRYASQAIKQLWNLILLYQDG